MAVVMTRKSEAVKCRVYHLSEALEGLVHSSIIVFGWEFAYSENGIAVTEPYAYEKGECKVAEFQLGTTSKTESELLQFIRCIRTTFKGTNYHILGRNCQTFVSELCKFLGVEDMFGNLVDMYKILATNKFINSSATFIHKNFKSFNSSGSSK